MKFRLNLFVVAFALLVLALPLSLQAKETRQKDIPPKRTVDFLHIKYDLRLDELKGHISGSVYHTVRPLYDGVTSLTLHAEGLNIKKVSLGGKSLDFEQQDIDLVINLGKAYNESQKFTIRVDYSGDPKQGIYFVKPDDAYPDKPYQIWTQGEAEDTHFWLPCYDFPNDLATSEGYITVRENLFVVGNGELLGVTEAKDGWKTYHWKIATPHVSYLISLVIGEFEEFQAEYGGVPIQYYVKKEDADKALRSFQKTPDMMKFFAESIGIPYPYEKYAQSTIDEFRWGGMENISATTQNANTLHDKRAHLDGNSDGLVAHELAHQWYGDLLTCRDWAHIWLNEGFATYFEALYRNHDKGEDEFKWDMAGNAQSAIGSDAERPRPIVDDIIFAPEDVFDGHAYGKGSWVLHMLRGYLGDETWWQGIHVYTKKHSRKTVTTDDLRWAMEDVSGKPLDWFFKQWLYQASEPHFKLKWGYDEESKLAWIDVEQTQTETELIPIFKVPVDIEFTTSQGASTYHVLLEGKKQRVYFPSEEKPLMVRFDKNGWVLKKVDFEKEDAEWLYQLQNDDDCLGRSDAAVNLAKNPSPENLKALKKTLLSDSFWGVRQDTADALKHVRSDEVRDMLIEASHDKDARVRMTVAQVLGKFEDEVSQTRLREMFEKDKSYKTQAEALFSLATQEPEDVKEILEQALTMDSHKEIIRRRAFDAYAKNKDEEALPVLEEWMAYGKPSYCRTGAMKAFVKLSKGDKAEEAAKKIIPFLNDPLYWVQGEAIRSLKKLKQPVAIPALAKFVAETTDNRQGNRARRAMEHLVANPPKDDDDDDDEHDD